MKGWRGLWGRKETAQESGEEITRRVFFLLEEFWKEVDQQYQMHLRVKEDEDWDKCCCNLSTKWLMDNYRIMQSLKTTSKVEQF